MRVGRTSAAITLGLMVAVACTTHPIGSRTSPSPGSLPSPTAVVTIPVTSPAPVTSGGFNPAQVVQVLGPAVAELIVTQAGGGGGIGSGFVIARDTGVSFLVTNNHVVANASRVIALMPDGRHFTATVQGNDPLQDIAVVKVADDSLQLAQFGDSTKLVAGQQVVAIGSPLGNQSSVTAGIISALHRTISTSASGGVPGESLPDVLQTDAAINPGNSGGPLADAAGNVIGVNTATNSAGQGIGYAIPSLIAKRIAQDLIAGLKAGDLIEKVDSVELNNGQTLGGAIQTHAPGETVQLTVLRGGSTTTLPLTLADRSSTSSSASCPAPTPYTRATT